MIIDNTPIEEYRFIDGQKIFVKREDLCCQYPGPPFSKVRGIYKKLSKLNQEGVRVVGYVETSISMAGWGLSWIAPQLGVQVVIYDPQYKHHTPPTLKLHRKKWAKFGAEIISIKAGMARVNYNICKNDLKERFPDAVMLELGLPFEETIEETCEEIKRTDNIDKYETIVVCVGSGTICSGILRGFNKKVIGVMSRSGNIVKKKNKIIGKSKTIFSQDRLDLFDPGYKYTDPENIKTPFPSNRFYDRKAWKWLVENMDKIKLPILFWNIGH